MHIAAYPGFSILRALHLKQAINIYYHVGMKMKEARFETSEERNVEEKRKEAERDKALG